MRFWAIIAPPGRRAPWIAAVVLGVVVGTVEMAAAGLVFAVLQVVSEGASQASVPLFGSLQDLTGINDDTRLVRVLALLTAAVFSLRGGLFLAHHYLQVRLAFRAGTHLSETLFRGYLEQPYVWHLKNNSANLAGDVVQAVHQTVVQVMVPVLAGVTQLILMLFLIAVLVVADPLTTIGAGVLLGIGVALLLRGVQKRLVSLGAVQLTEYKSSLKIVQEALRAIQDVKVLRLQERLTLDLSEHRRRQARADYQASLLTAVPRVAIESMAVGGVLVFLASRGAAASDRGDLATLGLFAYALMRLLPTVTALSKNITSARYGVAAVRALVAGLDLAGEDPSPAEPTESARFASDIRCSSVSFAYEEELVLEDIDLDVPAGKRLGIVGPSGGGKSTLLGILVGLLSPTGGEIRVGGQPLHAVREGWHRRLGFVPQQIAIIDDTLLANVCLGTQATVDCELLESALRLARLDELVGELPCGLETMLGEGGVRLSGGQQQRVALARAFYRHPEVLILDEGTSALDSETEGRIIDGVLSELSSTTLIMVAHRLTTVQGCDEIVVLESGRISGRGTYDELLTSSATFRRLASGHQP